MRFECKATIFDMDGTLLDSMRYWRMGCLEYLLALQLPVPEATLHGLFQKSTVRLIAETLETLGIAYDRDEIWREVGPRMLRHYMNDVKPKPGALAYLETLRARGVRMCVATASPRDYACAALARHGMHGLFEFITDEEQMGATKREPAFFEAVVRKLGLAPEDCVMYEDALYAMRSAKGAGLRVIAIEDEIARHDRDEILLLADGYATGYPELLNRMAESGSAGGERAIL